MNQIIYAGGLNVMDATQHSHEAWEYICCLQGQCLLKAEGREAPLHPGQAAIVPPGMPHALQGGEAVQVRMTQPILPVRGLRLVRGDEGGYMRDAFRAAVHHFHGVGRERDALLLGYGSLICHYFVALCEQQQEAGIAEEIERTIMAQCTSGDFRLDGYFATLPFSAGYLRRLFQQRFGATPHQYLMDLRLRMAAEALRHAHSGSYGVADIAAMCGFRDPLYFSRMFRKKYGVPPSKYT